MTSYGRIAAAVLLGFFLWAYAGGEEAGAALPLTTLASFSVSFTGVSPVLGNLLIDPAGNLFGATSSGFGTVFELVNNGGAYTLTPLVPFPLGAGPRGGLAMDQAGNLFGTAPGGTGFGIVFEIKTDPRNSTGYANAATILVAFNNHNGASPDSGVILDAAGNLFGTTETGGKYGTGTVFKIAKDASSATGYANTPITLVNFHGIGEASKLLMDAAGNLFGTTSAGGSSPLGAAFEVVKDGSTATGYRSTPKILISFNGVDGTNPIGGLIADSGGNLFGTTIHGGQNGEPNGDGTVFELIKNSDGSYTNETLFSFDGNHGETPQGGVVMDAGGNLFGTTTFGGSKDDGTVFELVKDASRLSGYAATPTVLVSFNVTNGSGPQAGVTVDAGGNLFGTTSGGGVRGSGVAYKLSGAGVRLSKNWQTADFNADHKSDILLQNTNGALSAWEMSGLYEIASGRPGNPGAAWRAIGAGYFFASPYADILLQNLGGAVEIWQMNHTKRVASAIVGNPGTAWRAVATGDFNGDGRSDILLQNNNGAVEIWEMNGFKVVASATVSNPGSTWHVVGAGDFNGDGRSDILLQNAATGQVEVWLMNGSKVSQRAVVGSPGGGWRAIGAGDFNGGGDADILWQNKNGAVEIWEMDGLKRVSSATVGNLGTSWRVIGSGDYNGDGKSDILLQNSNGAIEIWEMNGAKFVATSRPGNPGASWHVVGE